MTTANGTQQQRPLVEIEGVKKYFPVLQGLIFKRRVGEIKAVEVLRHDLAQPRAVEIQFRFRRPDLGPRPQQTIDGPAGFPGHGQRHFDRSGRRLQNDVPIPIVGGHVRHSIAGKGPHVEPLEQLRPVFQPAVEQVGAQDQRRRTVAIEERLQERAVRGDQMANE